MHLDTLNALYSLPGTLVFQKGSGGLPLAHITTPHATAAITPYGAQLLSCRFSSHSDDLLFLSENAIFKEGTPIRGGVPICWPWFGPDPQHKGGPDHGLARTRMWNVVSSALTHDGGCSITFELTDTPETFALWPHHFKLSLQLCITTILRIELSTQNCGDTPMELTQALHTYFYVGDILHSSITGLEGCTYVDKTDSGNEKNQEGDIRIEGETDRIYADDGRDIVIRDITHNRNIRIESKGSQTAVVWNPWIRVCENKSDLALVDYKKMICVETANAGDDIIIVQPGERHTLSAIYSLHS
jgi:glucose-6-phosphate 1-epimerase